MTTSVNEKTGPSLLLIMHYKKLYNHRKTANYLEIFIFAATTQVRFAHTDIQVPDFTPYRRDSTKRAASKAQTAEERMSFSYALVGGKESLTF